MTKAAGTIQSAFARTERQIIELYEVTLVTSAVYYFANYETDVPSRAEWGGVPWTALPGLKRDAMRTGADLRVDDLLVTVGNGTVTFNNTTTPLAAIAMRGILDGAQVRIYRADLQTPTNTRMLHSLWTVQGAEADRSEVKLRLESPLAQFNAVTPRRSWQEQCTWSLFSSWCTLVRSQWTVHATVMGSGTTVDHIQCRISSVGASVPGTIQKSWFQLGEAVFTSGADQGLRRTIRTHSVSTVSSPGTILGYDLLLPLPIAPASGDVISMVPGCDKSLNACVAKFNNISNYGGFPYVPKAEAIYGF